MILKRLFAFLFVFSIYADLAFAQITGEILDATDNYPIPYASASYNGHKIAVSSDGNGRFNIERHNGW